MGLGAYVGGKQKKNQNNQEENLIFEGMTKKLAPNKTAAFQY